MTNMPIRFPGLFPDWQFDPNPVAIDVGNGIYLMSTESYLRIHTGESYVLTVIFTRP